MCDVNICQASRYPAELREKGVLSFWYSLPMARPHFGPIDLPPPPLLDDHGSFLEVGPGTLPLTDSRSS